MPGETFESEDLRCPYCKELISDSWECFNEDEESEIECDCGKKFYGYKQISVSYKGVPNCELNNKKHDYIKIESRSFKKCSECGDIKSLDGEDEDGE